MPSSARVLSGAIFHTLRISVPTVLDSFGGRVSMAECDARLDSWSKALLRDVNLTFDVTGRENIQAGEVYVVMSNHASHYDIPILFQALGIPLRMVAKTELFRVPIWGRAMTASGFIEIDRGNKERAIESLQRAKERMQRDHLSVWIAPEGTRSRTGEMGEFKQGGFHMAIDAQLRILPVTIVGSHSVLGKGQKSMGEGTHVTVKVHAPVDAASYGQDRRAELVALVREVISSGLKTSV